MWRLMKKWKSAREGSCCLSECQAARGVAGAITTRSLSSYLFSCSVLFTSRFDHWLRFFPSYEIRNQIEDIFSPPSRSGHSLNPFLSSFICYERHDFAINVEWKRSTKSANEAIVAFPRRWQLRCRAHVRRGGWKTSRNLGEELH